MCSSDLYVDVTFDSFIRSDSAQAEDLVLDDAATGITARKRRTATLVVDESNWTPELMASDMNCPDASGENRILGFVLTFDPVTGELLGVKIKSGVQIEYRSVKYGSGENDVQFTLLARS